MKKHQLTTDQAIMLTLFKIEDRIIEMKALVEKEYKELKNESLR